MRIYKFLLVGSVLLSSLSVKAQDKDAASAKTTAAPKSNNDGYKPQKIFTFGTGLANYYGDLTENSKLFNQSSIAFSAGFSYSFSPFFFINTELSFLQLQATDSKNAGAQYKARNLNFKSNVVELSTVFEAELLNSKKFKMVPYVFIGVGVFHFNPYTKDNTGAKRILQPLGTEGQGLAQYPGRELYKRTQGIIPLGGGIKYAINNKIGLQLDFKYRITGTDYLDDVSVNRYPDKAFLDARDPTTALLTYRGAGPYPDKNNNLPRGNPAKKDIYYTTQLKIAFKL